MSRSFSKGLPLLGLLLLVLVVGCTSQQAMKPEPASGVDLEMVKAGKFDTGKMWTFDYPPMDYFKQVYNFTPTKEWFEKARLSALRLPGCSASFVSEDGLVMTNHHCARGALDRVNKEGEDLPNLGFYAATLEEERKIPNYYADQLVLIEDVTEEVQKAFASGGTDEEKIARRNEAIASIQARYEEKTKLNCSVYTFFNGGKYSLYGFKRYNDVRLVFAPHQVVAFFGGDPDNFTYPRYDMDVTFYRIYDEDGKPLKTSNFFKWSKAGAAESDPVFVIGNPGGTTRLNTVAQLLFTRDYTYRVALDALKAVESITEEYVQANPEKRPDYQTQIFGLANSRKLIDGRLKGLHDPIIMAKKRDFEKTLKDKVMANPEWKATYGSIWDDIAGYQEQKAEVYALDRALNLRGLGRSTIGGLASGIVDYAKNSMLPEDQRPRMMQGPGLERVKTRLTEATVNTELDQKILEFQLEFMQTVFGSTYAPFNELMAGQSPAEAAKRLMSSSMLTDQEKVKDLLSKAPAEILATNDPWISFVVKSADRAEEIGMKYQELRDKEAAKVQLLGLVVFGVYGTSIPPDATFSLRIADGVVKGYDYNGTIAPPNTTFYGMFDRYYSYGKQAPWMLPEEWLNAGSEFDLKTPLNFVSTNDIIGGNSGSPVINSDLQIVGIVFDGNIESLPGDYIYDETVNRCVSVHSAGILEAVQDIYKAERLSKELKAGKISP